METQKTESQKTRIVWMEYAKGFAIFGVVLFHVAGGILSANVSDDPALMRFVFVWEWFAFRAMPVFFLISGILAVRSIQKPAADFLRDKLRTIIYPYVLWSMITIFVGQVMGQYTNNDVSLASTPEILYNPLLHYWFLYALFVIMIVHLIFHTLRLNIWWMVALGVVLYIVSESLQLIDFSYVLSQICIFLIVYAFGVANSERIVRFVDTLSTANHLMIAAVSVIIFALFYVAGDVRAVSIWLYPISGIAVTAFTVSASELLVRFNALGVIRYWGQVSFEVYLVHVLALVGTRTILMRFLGIDNVLIHLVAGIVVGIYGPIILVWVLNKIGFKYAFSLPKTRTKPAGDIQMKVSGA